MSPYEHMSAREHHEAPLSPAKTHRGPTEHTRMTLPDWDGRYSRGARDVQWLYGGNVQTARMLSLHTPAHQTRMAQMNYHEAVSNAPQWMAAFCYPEGPGRWWTCAAIRDIEVLVTTHEVQFTAGVADNGRLLVEATFYDPAAFYQPLPMVTLRNFAAGIDDPNRRYSFPR